MFVNKGNGMAVIPCVYTLYEGYGFILNYEMRAFLNHGRGLVL